MFIKDGVSLKGLIYILLIFLSVPVYSETLVTDKFEMHVTRNCEEGVVSCSNMLLNIYELPDLNLKTKAKGTTIHSVCKDGSLCGFKGYKFEAGAHTFYLYSDGTVNVYLDAKAAPHYSAQGKWVY